MWTALDVQPCSANVRSNSPPLLIASRPAAHTCGNGLRALNLAEAYGGGIVC